MFPSLYKKSYIDAESDSKFMNIQTHKNNKQDYLYKANPVS